MRIAVLVKSVPDTATVITVEEGNTSFNTDDVEYVVNPYDEYAIEEAIRLKENFSGEVVAISMGDDNAARALRSALAMGADRAILVREPPASQLTGRAAAKVLAEVVRTLSPDLILGGKQAVDTDEAQVPERVAEILGVPHAAAITRLSLHGRTAHVERENEGGQYTVDVPLPALFTTQKGINIPRYPTLPNILKSQRAELEEIPLRALGLLPEDLRPGVQIDSLQNPLQRRGGNIMRGDAGTMAKEIAGILQGNGIVA